MEEGKEERERGKRRGDRGDGEEEEEGRGGAGRADRRDAISQCATTEALPRSTLAKLGLCRAGTSATWTKGHTAESLGKNTDAQISPKRKTTF